MALPEVRIETGPHPHDTRIWLAHESFGKIEVTHFCQAVKKTSGSPVAYLRLVALDSTGDLKRELDVDVTRVEKKVLIG